jgi:Uncharacterised nucleotidyltransferase
MRCLLALLRGQGVDPDAHDPEWEAVLALAEEQHILPWVVRLLSRQTSAKTSISSRLSGIEREAAIGAFYWGAELTRVLRAFEQHGLVTVPLKGPFLAERLYGATELRVSHDLDLLVSKDDVVRADAVLAELGFAPGAPDDYHRQWYKGPTTVELHHDVENPLAFNFHVAGALRRARKAAFQGQGCWQLAPEDELLFLCLHAVRHRFERLSLIVDLQLAFEKLTAAGAWQPRSEVAELDNLLTLGFAMVRRLQPEIDVTIPLPGSTKQVQHLEGIAGRLWHQLLTQTSETLDWREVHSFYLQIEMPGRNRLGRRLRHLRILMGRAIEPDYQFAARLGFHRDWQVQMLRPLRLLSDLMRE